MVRAALAWCGYEQLQMTLPAVALVARVARAGRAGGEGDALAEDQQRKRRCNELHHDFPSKGWIGDLSVANFILFLRNEPRICHIYIIYPKWGTSNGVCYAKAKAMERGYDRAVRGGDVRPNRNGIKRERGPH